MNFSNLVLKGTLETIVDQAAEAWQGKQLPKETMLFCSPAKMSPGLGSPLGAWLFSSSLHSRSNKGEYSNAKSWFINDQLYVVC